MPVCAGVIYGTYMIVYVCGHIGNSATEDYYYYYYESYYYHYHSQCVDKGVGVVHEKEP